MRKSKWLRQLAYLTGSVNQELLLHEYLAAKNRIRHDGLCELSSLSEVIEEAAT